MSEKYNHLSRINLDAKLAGHTVIFRSNMTRIAMEMYDAKIKSGTVYRTKSQVQEAARLRPSKSTWFSKSGEFNAVINVPPTPDQELLNMTRKTLSEISYAPGTKVKVQQSFGTTIMSQIMTRDIGTNKLCTRDNCMVCSKSGSKGGCQDQSVTYQITCDRSPCSSRTDLGRPLLPPAPGPDPPALYRGETSRDCYIRGTQHNSDYRSKTDGSSLWRHTVSHHDGVIGDNNGVSDYYMTRLDKLSKPLDRVAAEGILIGDLEKMDNEDRAISLNSKRDFMQADTVTLTFNRGAQKEG